MEITAPKLKPGMLQIETMMEMQIGEAQTSIETMVNSLAIKPELMGALANAAASAALTPLIVQPHHGLIGISVGSMGGAQSYIWDPTVLGSLVEQIKPEDDPAIGAGLSPLQFMLDGDLGFLVPGLSVRGTFGYLEAPLQAAGYQFTFQTLQAGGAVAWQIGRTSTALPIGWDGVGLQVGFSWLHNRIGTTLVIDPIVQVFSLDPDGAGPFLPLDVSIQVNPQLDVALQTDAWVVPIQLFTGFRLADFFCLSLGGGVDFSGGNAGLSLEGTQEIQVLGFLSKLIETPGTITISGVTRGAQPDLVHGFVAGCLQLRAMYFTLSIPVAWRFDSGLSLGMVVGVQL